MRSNRWVAHRRWLALGGAAFALLAVALWRPIQHRCTVFLLLRAEAPSPEVLEDTVARARDPGTLLARLWQTRRLPQRRFVAEHLKRVSLRQAALGHALEPALLEAVEDADLAVREPALAALIALKHPQARPLALVQLSDPDPAVRALGLQSLCRLATSNDVPTAIRLLSDPDPRVVVVAGSILRRVVGQDFGLRLSLAPPWFDPLEGADRPSSPDWTAIHAGGQRWRQWWERHASDYPTLPPSPRRSRHATLSPAPEVALPDLAGRRVRLSDYRGKVLFLVFWSLESPGSLGILPELNALPSRHAGQLAVLGVCLPGLPSCHKHADDAHGHEPSAPDRPRLAVAELREAVQTATRQKRLGYPIVLDSNGALGARFGVEALPTFALIDPAGRLRRCFPGSRSDAVFEAMIAELVLLPAAGPGPSARAP